jgi:hypothetical protein
MKQDNSVRCDWDILFALTADKKFVEGEGGWLFLANDTNNQLAQQFGLKRWTESEVNRSNEIIKQRKNQFPGYKKFIIPEKSVIYREYMPAPMRHWVDYYRRPAFVLSTASYLLSHLVAAKPVAGLYFRGDTHPNWLGSYFIYCAITRQLGMTPLKLSDFTPDMAGYDGDLIAHFSADEREAFLGRVDHFPNTLDITPILSLTKPKAQHLGTGGYDQFSRETLVYENPDKSLPNAVIFRDSTCQFAVPWLAEHFSRSVFVWHRGDVLSEVIDREKPDIVFQIMAERFVWSYPERTAFA